VAAVAATLLYVFEMGDTENAGERNRLCAQKYLQHIDHLVAGTEMELTPNPFAPWPRWPDNVSVGDAKIRDERPDLVWKRGIKTAPSWSVASIKESSPTASRGMEFGSLGDNHYYICSEKGEGPQLCNKLQGIDREPRSIAQVKMEGDDKENKQPFPVNPNPVYKS
jgi:hypothetical protein